MGTETPNIAIKFGMLVIGLGENAASIDQLAQRKKCFLGGIPQWSLVGVRRCLGGPHTWRRAREGEGVI